MKRKLCTPPFNCDDMEELNVTALSRRKESAAPLTGDRDAAILRHSLTYPLALVLRLRVLQVWSGCVVKVKTKARKVRDSINATGGGPPNDPLTPTEEKVIEILGSAAIYGVTNREYPRLIVCGISAMVMGSVAFIEERQKFNMGLGIPAGGISVLAAAVSIHTSRGWGAAASAAGAGAGAAGVLWVAATCLLIALVVQCCRTILDPPGLEHSDGPTEEDSRPSSRDLVVIACVQIALAVATLLSAAICARIDYST